MSSSSSIILRSILGHKATFRKSTSIAWKYLPLYNRLCMCKKKEKNESRHYVKSCLVHTHTHELSGINYKWFPIVMRTMG